MLPYYGHNTMVLYNTNRNKAKSIYNSHHKRIKLHNAEELITLQATYELCWLDVHVDIVETQF